MTRLDYLLYRCFGCGRIITDLEVERGWESAEKTEDTVAPICPCGSTKITPSNLTPEEHKKYNNLWQQFRYLIGLRDENTRIAELYYKRIKGKTLPSHYKVGK